MHALEGLSFEFKPAGILTMFIFKCMVLTESSDEPRTCEEKVMYFEDSFTF